MRLVIISAFDGVSHSIELPNDSVPVHAVQDELSHATNIPTNDQILLFGPPFARLDPRKSLYEYDLPSASKEVFLYDRRSLSSKNATARLAPPIIPQEIIVPKSTASLSNTSSSRLLSESSSPLLRALADYEQQFLLQFETSRALEAGAVSRIEICKKGISEIKGQGAAVKAAVSNLETFQNSIAKRFEGFYNEFKTDCTRHEELLRTFHSDLEALGEVTLHPVLRTVASSSSSYLGSSSSISSSNTSSRRYRKTLLDCIPVEREEQWASDCAKSHDKIKSKVAELVELHQKVMASQDLEINENAAKDKLAILESQLSELVAEAQEQKSFSSILEENYRKVIDRVEETSSLINHSEDSMVGSTNALEACRGLDELWRDQAGFVPQMEAFDEKLRVFMTSISDTRVSMSEFVHNHLWQVSSVQSEIRNLSNTLGMLKDASVTQRSQFQELEHLKQLPVAYKACLSEVVRRRKYGRLISQKLEDVAEEFASRREDEIVIRDKFLKKHGQHLPRDFIPGLAEKPSHCEIRARAFDQSLPMIDDESLLEEESTTTESIEESINSIGGGSLLMAGNPNWNTSRASEERCEELEAEVERLRKQVRELGKKKESVEDVKDTSDLAITKSGGGFPVLLAIAAAADIATSSEGSSSSLLENSTQLQEEVFRAKEQAESFQSRICELEKELEKTRTDVKDKVLKIQEENDVLQATIKSVMEEVARKDSIVTKLKTEQQQYTLNAAEMELDMNERKEKEKQLTEANASLQNKTSELLECIKAHQDGVSTIIELCCDEDKKAEASSSRDLINASMVPYLVKSIQQKLQSAQAPAANMLVKDLRSKLQVFQDQNVQLKYEIQALQSSKISFRQFAVDDLALFLPTCGPDEDSRVYLAFHLSAPHRYLSQESISSFQLPNNRNPDYILGKIVFIDEHVASERYNPFRLTYGTTFYVVMVTSLTD